MSDFDYIPKSDNHFRVWSDNLATQLTLQPAAYLMTAAQALVIRNLANAYNAAFIVANAEATRTAVTIAAKDDARSECETLCRQIAMIIKPAAGITDENKIAAGIRPPNEERERRDCPQTSPLLNIIGNTPGVQTLRFADSTTPDSRARPFGAASLLLYRGVGTTEPLPLNQCQFYGVITRNPIDVEFSEADDGKISTFYGQWCSVRGETGPWSLPVSMRVAA